MYELALREWGLTPEYINNGWTEELLMLMLDKMTEHYQRMAGKKTGSGRKKIWLLGKPKEEE